MIVFLQPMRPVSYNRAFRSVNYALPISQTRSYNASALPERADNDAAVKRCGEVEDEAAGMKVRSGRSNE
jgi:hypothetical protein